MKWIKSCRDSKFPVSRRRVRAVALAAWRALNGSSPLVAHPSRSPPVASSITRRTRVGVSKASTRRSTFSCAPHRRRIVISVRSDSSSLLSPPLRFRLTIIFRAKVSFVALSSTSTTLPKLPWPKNRSFPKPVTFRANLDANSALLLTRSLSNLARLTPRDPHKPILVRESYSKRIR